MSTLGTPSEHGPGGDDVSNQSQTPRDTAGAETSGAEPMEASREASSPDTNGTDMIEVGLPDTMARASTSTRFKTFGQLDIATLDTLAKLADKYVELRGHREKIDQLRLIETDADYAQTLKDWGVEMALTKERLKLIATAAAPYLQDLVTEILPAAETKRPKGSAESSAAERTMLSGLLLAVAYPSPPDIVLPERQLRTLYHTDLLRQRTPTERGLFAIAIDIERRMPNIGRTLIYEHYRDFSHQYEDVALLGSRVRLAEQITRIDPTDAASSNTTWRGNRGTPRQTAGRWANLWKWLNE